MLFFLGATHAIISTLCEQGCIAKIYYAEKVVMLISRFFIEFLLFSLGGWVYESIYCTVTKGHWTNRGFLFGPICPIYGFGAMTVRLFAYYVPLEPGRDIPLWAVFVSFMAVSAVLEYITSWVMEKMFHARWWDYSNMPLNLNGRICLPASLLFGAAGTLGWVYIIPILPKNQAMTNSLLVEGAALVLMGVLAGDLAISVESTRNLIEKLEKGEAIFNDAAEKGYLRIRSIPGRVHDAGNRVKAMGPKLIHSIENPSVQLKDFAQKLSGRERHVLSHISIYHQIGVRKKKDSEGNE